jgi:hypothetical protein
LVNIAHIPKKLGGWSPAIKPHRRILTRRGYRAGTIQFHFLGGWFDMRDLGAVLDHEGSLGERRLTVAATKAFHASSCFW